MKVKEIMTKDVFSVSPEDKIQSAAKIMEKHNIGSVPVCEGEHIMGILTDRDIALRSVSNGENINMQKVRDIMSSNPVFGTPDMDVTEASKIMSDRQIRRLPIVENNNLVGIISLGDIAVEPTFSNKAGETLTDISMP